jgi:ribosomal protein L19
MKINPILQKFESNLIKNKSKNIFAKTVSKGDIVSVIYFDLEKEQTRVQQFTGICRYFKSSGYYSIFAVYNVISKFAIQHQFFLYSNIFVDVMVVRKKNK